jgi:micrococcal nuclease
VTGKLFGLLFLACLFLVQPVLAEETTIVLHGEVNWVYDGDTLQVSSIGKVRLVGIDSPEKEASSRDQYLLDKGIPAATQREIYRAAKEFNINQVKGKDVTLVLEDSARDRHGRLLAYVYLPDGRLLNRLLIEQGLAVVYRRFTFSMKQEFLEAEAEAVLNGAGMWAKPKE